MESSGIYWKAPYNVLAKAPITSHILNPFSTSRLSPVRKSSNRCSVDYLLSIHNLVRPSHIPEPMIMQLRLLTRQRRAVVSSLRRTKNGITHYLRQNVILNSV